MFYSRNSGTKINRRRFFDKDTVTANMTDLISPDLLKAEGAPEVVDSVGREGWLGDEDSNLGRQIQSLSSYH